MPDSGYPPLVDHIQAWESVGGGGVAGSLRRQLLLVSVEGLASKRFDIGSGPGYGAAGWVQPVVSLVDKAIAFWANGVSVLPKVGRWDSA